MLNNVVDCRAVALIDAALRVCGIELFRAPHINPVDTGQSRFADHSLAYGKRALDTLSRL